MYALAIVYDLRNDAINLWEEILAKYGAMLGEDHLHTVASTHNLCPIILDSSRRKREGVKLAERRPLEDDHPHTIATIRDLLSIRRNEMRFLN